MGKRGVLALAWLLTACVSISPAVVRNVATLPDNPDRKQEQQASTQARPTADTRKPMSKRMRKIESAAATAAAVIGVLFSTSRSPDPNPDPYTRSVPEQSALVGVGIGFEETQLGDKNQGKKPKRKPEPDEAPPPAYDDANKIVPWLRFDRPKR